jgi:ABC-type Fe3+ transport system permease subunit/DNA-binding beta-propeller fold protein YncE
VNWLLLQNSLLVAGASTLAAVALGFAAAVWLAGLPPAWRSSVLALAILALAVPPFLAVNCWLDLLGTAGAWRGWLPLNILSLGGTVWILSLLLWPITCLAVLSAWHRLEPPQIESDMAVTGWAFARALLLPLAGNALALAGILTFVLALNNFVVPAILQTKVFPAELWIRFSTGFDTLGALRLSWPLVAVPLVLLLWLARCETPWPHLRPQVSAGLFRRQLAPTWFWISGSITTLACGGSVVLPVALIATTRRTWTELPGALAAGRGAIWNSFAFAAGSATLILAIALLSIALKPRALRRFGSVAPLWLLFLTPGVLTGIGLILLFNNRWFAFLYRSAGIVILAFVLRYLALGWTAAAHATARLDPDLTDAARLDGANRRQLFQYIHWPQLAPPIAAAWYIVFLLCLWDVESIVLVVPPGGETLPLRIFNLLHYGHNPQVNALCLVLLGLAIIPLLLWKTWGLLRPRKRSPGFQTSLNRMKEKTAAESHPSKTLDEPGHSGSADPMSRSGNRRSSPGQARIAGVFAPLRAGCLAALVLLPAGCGPDASPGGVPLHSRLFSGVQIIGSRGAGVGEFIKPRSVAVDASDNLYVADMTGRIQKFSSSGAHLLSWQMPQTDKGKPKGMCRDRDGNIVVIEPHYQRLSHFTGDGVLVAQWGGQGTNDGQFTLPRAVAVNSRGEALVSEYGRAERVQKFALAASANGPPALLNPPLKRGVNENQTQAGERSGKQSFATWVATFGTPGNQPGQFNRPEGLCVDGQDRIYVADSCNHRIQIFSGDGRFLRAYGAAGSGPGQLSYPYDICVDSLGLQFVCEFGNSRIQIFGPDCEPIEIVGGPGSDPGRFSNPWGVALDAGGNLYVADSQNHRVQKLIRRGGTASGLKSVAAAK